MNDLIEKLTAELNLDPVQARAAVGSLLGVARGVLDPSAFAKVVGAVPEADTMEAEAKVQDAAPGTEAPGVDRLAGFVTDLAGSVGGDPARQLAGAAGSLGKQGLGAASAMAVLPKVLEYLQTHGGEDAGKLLAGVMGR